MHVDTYTLTDIKKSFNKATDILSFVVSSIIDGIEVLFFCEAILSSALQADRI